MTVGMHALAQNLSISVVEAAGAAGTTDLTSDSVDMANHEGVMFVAHLGDLTATQVTNLYGQQSEDDSSFADLLATRTASMADGDSNKLLILDFFRPRERYVRVILDRGTADAVLNGIVAYRYGPRTMITAETSSISDLEVHVSPAEGTP